MPKKILPFVFVASLFGLLCAPGLFSRGMFMDGLIYASVARNMANDMGSFWQPHYSALLFNHFYEHPPLAMGLQSLWFRLFGDSFLIERFYALFSYFLTGGIIIAIWKQLNLPSSKAWLPLLFWISVPNMAWACSNNMLENTMMVFTTASLLFYLKSLHKQFFLWILLSGISLSLAFLSKGFFALYLWSAPAFLWLCTKKISFPKAVTHSLALIGFTALPLLLCIWLSPDALLNLQSYFEKQVMGSIQAVQTVNSRFAILGEFCMGILPAMILGLLIWLFAKRPKPGFTKHPMAFALFCLCLAGVLPIMISLKQRGFYILTVYPFFALALGMIALPWLLQVEARWKSNKTGSLFKWITLGTFLAAVGGNLYFAQSSGRDVEKRKDIRTVLTQTGENTTIGLCPQLYTDWSLHAYFQRYGHLSLDAKTPLQYTYYLSPVNNCAVQPDNNYTAVDLPLHNYTLLKRSTEKR